MKLSRRQLQQRKKDLVRHELFLHLRKFLINFKSKEVPRYKELTKDDVIWTLSRFIKGLAE